MKDKFLFAAVTAKAIALVVNPILKSQGKSYQLDEIRFHGGNYAVFTTNSTDGIQVFVTAFQQSFSVASIDTIKEYAGSNDEDDENLLQIVTQDLELTLLYTGSEDDSVYASRDDVTMFYNDIVLGQREEEPNSEMELEFAVFLKEEQSFNPKLLSVERCYINQYGYSNLSSMAIDESKLIGVEIIDDIEEAERRFKERNGMDDDDGVFIPSVFEKDGIIYAEDLNSCACPIEESSAEEYINNYQL